MSPARGFSFTPIAFRVAVTHEVASSFKGALCTPSPHFFCRNINSNASVDGMATNSSSHFSEEAYDSFKFCEKLFRSLICYVSGIEGRVTGENPAVLSCSAIIPKNSIGGEEDKQVAQKPYPFIESNAYFCVPITIEQCLLGERADHTLSFPVSSPPSSITWLRATIHDTRLASAIHAILCRKHFLALELCRITLFTDKERDAHMEALTERFNLKCSKNKTNINDYGEPLLFGRYRLLSLEAAMRTGDEHSDPEHLNMDSELWDVLKQGPSSDKGSTSSISTSFDSIYTLKSMLTWIEDHVRCVGVLSNAGDSASPFAHAMKRMSKGLVIPSDISSSSSVPTAVTPAVLLREFASHPNHYVRAVGLFYMRYMFPIEELVPYVLAQTKDGKVAIAACSSSHGEDQSSHSIANITTTTMHALCAEILYKAECCDALPPLYDIDILIHLPMRFSLYWDAMQRHEAAAIKVEENRNKHELEKLQRMMLQRQAGSVHPPAEDYEGGGVTCNKAKRQKYNSSSFNSISSLGFESVSAFIDYQRRETRIQGAIDTQFVDFTDEQYDIHSSSDGDDSENKTHNEEFGYRHTKVNNKANIDGARSGMKRPRSHTNIVGGDVVKIVGKHATDDSDRDHLTIPSASSAQSNGESKNDLEQQQERRDNMTNKNTKAFLKAEAQLSFRFSHESLRVIMDLLGRSDCHHRDDPVFLLMQ
eukprot:Tbor_TRINITY_DN917_c0_g1::TRINITY_DN917_c0_g1_i1::g.21219::m.21219